jgi:hypothetical protein
VEYGAYADFDGSTMIFRSDLAGFEIMTIEGRKLLSIPI